MTTTVEPVRDLLSEYREAIARGELLIPRCRHCGRLQFPPMAACQGCSTINDWEMAPVSGRGTIWTYVVFVKRYLANGPETPYNVAIVELEEGPRVTARIVGTDGFSIGDRVEAGFDGHMLPFSPTAAG